MRLVVLFSGLLLLGLGISQVSDLGSYMPFLTNITLICLAYIMIEVGLEFKIRKDKLAEYGKDYLIAATAASFPWILCALYFIFVLNVPYKEAWLVSRFSAPTSAGLLFAMLLAAGLGSTWVFKKVEVLAIFDDLDTILLLIPLQFILVGFKPELLIAIIVIAALLSVAYKLLHQVNFPYTKGWMIFYSVAIVSICKGLEHIAHIHIEVLIPAFCFGCVIKHNVSQAKATKEQSSPFDIALKSLFMFLVGTSLPKIDFTALDWQTTALHVIIITIISNIGKCFPILCYKNQATLKERIAVGISLFPRGEVGAAVLLIAIGYKFTGIATTLAGLSLALNLILTGLFIMIVISLVKPKTDDKKNDNNAYASSRN